VGGRRERERGAIEKFFTITRGKYPKINGSVDLSENNKTNKKPAYYRC
jgi:hypothetical protein